jgi:hypothetical protein
MIPELKTKHDLVRALNTNVVRLLSTIEVVNDSGLKAVTEKAKSLLRQQKKLHLIVLERD